METSDARRVWRDEQERLANLCARAAAEARRLVTRELFGPTLAQLLGRVSDILDEIDDVLMGLDPDHDGDAFARAAALHRELEAIQARVPREHRRMLCRTTAATRERFLRVVK